MNKLKMIIPLLLVSCNGIGISSDYFPLLLETPKRMINNFKPYYPEDDYIQNQQSSFVTVELGQNNAILVLKSIEKDIFTWVGLDDVVLKTYKGFVIRTIGLEHNLEIINPISSIDSMLNNNNNTLLLNFDNPRLYELSASLERIYQSTDMIELELDSDDINWSVEINVEYEPNGLPAVSNQSLHPFLKSARLRFYYKY